MIAPTSPCSGQSKTELRNSGEYNDKRQAPPQHDGHGHVAFRANRSHRRYRSARPGDREGRLRSSQ